MGGKNSLSTSSKEAGWCTLPSAGRLKWKSSLKLLGEVETVLNVHKTIGNHARLLFLCVVNSLDDALLEPWRLKGAHPMRLTRTLLAVLLGVFVYATIGTGPAQGRKAKPPCRQDLAHCPDEGCGADFDPNLNKLKNIRSDDPRAVGPATPRTLTWMKKLDDPESFQKGDSREELTELGEGQRIAVVAYLLAAKPELGGESCNCGLHTRAETDNHLVLVTKATVDKFSLDDDEATNKKIFHSREMESLTAEFTPRVRLAHPNFTREKVQPMIDATDQNALLVRVTGLLMFDSEHFIRNHLVRVNNWEIHPVLKLEVCTTGDKCTAKSDAGWKSLDDM